jgi:uncharacterized protein YndB with AHSA1/START domain
MKTKKTVIKAEPGKQEIFITGEFDAPRELVFRAHTDPELFVRWLGPQELTMKRASGRAENQASPPIEEKVCAKRA